MLTDLLGSVCLSNILEKNFLLFFPPLVILENNALHFQSTYNCHLQTSTQYLSCLKLPCYTGV